jgi:hypothetical protein
MKAILAKADLYYTGFSVSRMIRTDHFPLLGKSVDVLQTSPKSR